MDNKATALVIQIMPLMMREFQIRVDSAMMLSDRVYASSVFELVRTSTNERLRRYAEQLYAQLQTLESGPAPAAATRAAGPTAPSIDQRQSEPPASEPALDEAEAPRQAKYTRSLR